METEITEPVGIESQGQSLLGNRLRLVSELGKRKLISGATAGLLGGLALITACGGVKEAQEPTMAPTPVNPSPTATETMQEPMPSLTATIVPEKPTETATVSVTPTPEAIAQAPTTQNPEPTVPPEIVKPKRYTIEIIPPDPARPAYETHTEEEARQIIDDIASRYPILGELKIKIALGGGSHCDGCISGLGPDGRFPITIDRASNELKTDTLHELVHSWLWVIENQPEVFAEHKQAELLSLIDGVLADSQIGRSYPSVDRLFSGDYTEALRRYRGQEVLDLENFRVLTSKQANDFWIYDERTNPLNEFLKDEELDSKSKPIPIIGDEGGTNVIKYSTLQEFVQSEQEFLSALSARNKHWEANLAQIEANVQKYEPYAKKAVPALLYDQQSANWYKTLKILGWLTEAERFLQDDPMVRELFGSDETRVQLGLEARKKRADGEKLAETVSKHMILTEEGRLTEKNQVVEAFIQAIYNYE